MTSDDLEVAVQGDLASVSEAHDEGVVDPFAPTMTTAEAYSRAVADAADMARLVRRYREFLASPDGDGFTESEYAEFVAARLPDPDVWPDLSASLARLEDADALYNAFYPQSSALSPAVDPSHVRDTVQTEDDTAVASSATELDQQWWNDRAHGTHDVADTTRTDTTRTDMASDASSDLFSDEAGADQDDGWSR